mgnify:CR=1 FL=1
MTARELAEILLQNPYNEVYFTIGDGTEVIVLDSDPWV